MPTSAGAVSAHRRCPFVIKSHPQITHGNLQMVPADYAGIVGRPDHYRDEALLAQLKLSDTASHTIRGRYETYFQLDNTPGRPILDSSTNRFGGRRLRGVYLHNGHTFATRWVTLPAHASGVCKSRSPLP